MIRAFGGDWTEKKLKALEKYLNAYLRIMRKNERAKNFTVVYVDGFAGSGRRYTKCNPDSEEIRPLFDNDDRNKFIQYYDGSTRVALRAGNSSGFDKYIFIETDSDAIEALKQLRNEFQSKDIEIVQQDANTYIQQWCSTMDAFWRSVMFLDPFGLQVEWATIKSIAKTEKIDLWLLIPLGQAILRMLPKCRTPSEKVRDLLNKFFGTEEWLNQFYEHTGQGSLFNDENEKDEVIQRTANIERIKRYILNRLKTVFPKEGVADEILILRNSKNAPMYMLCFAASNPKGASTAVKIARHILCQEHHS